MRIIAGKHKGRNLLSPTDKGIRPTSSKIRESMFNILINLNAIEDSNVIDLCCGTGALGIEALSRGAAKVVFIDGSNQHLKIAYANIVQVNETEKSTILRANAEDLPQAREKFNLVFIDPPYFKKVADKALISLIEKDWLAEKAIILIEQDRREDLVFSTDHYQQVMERSYGNSKIILLERL